MARFATVQNSLGDAINTLADKADVNATRTVTAVAAASTITLTAAQMVNGIVTHTGGSTCTVTTPTAAAIVAAIPDCQVGYAFELHVVNNNSGSTSFTGGTGVTIPALLATVATGTVRTIKGVVTNVATPAVQLY